MQNPKRPEYFGANFSVKINTLKISGVFLLLLVCFCISMAMNTYAQLAASNTSGNKPLRLGLLPHLNTQVTIEKYTPLINYLQTELQRQVIFTTAPDFKTYIQRAENDDFDLYLTAPNIAAYHEKHDKHLRVAKFTEKLQGVIVVAEDSPYHSLDDLEGKTMATPDIMAVITSLGEVTLLENGIVPGKDIQIMYTDSHNKSLQSVVTNKADAAVVGYPSYKIITTRTKLRKPVRILIETKKIPHLMFMSPPGVSLQERELFKSALKKFSSSDAGGTFFSGLPFKGISTISDADMMSLKELLKLLEQRLKK